MRPPPLDRRALTAAVPDFGLAATFLIAWIAPGTLGPGGLAQLTVIMLLEFIIVHSSAFAGGVMTGKGTPRAKLIGLCVLGGFYTIFVGGFAIAFHTGWPVISFWLLMLNRMLGVLIGQAPEGEERLFIRRSWAASTLLYLVFGGLTVMLPVPRLGLTAAIVASQHLPGGGLWIEQPHRPVAFGFLYFVATAISELYGHRWIRARDLPAETRPSLAA